MPTLEELPHEISAEILSYLPSSDLATTSTLSRHMHALSDAVLYKTPILMANDGTGPTVLRMFLRTLLSHGGETRASCVRSIDVQLDMPIGWVDDDAENSEHTPDMVLLGVAATSLGLQGSLASQGAQIVLLLHLLPRLQVLDITPTFNTDVMFSALLEATNLARSTANIPPGLRHLRTIRCNSPHTNGGMGPGTLLTLLLLPCIRKIDARINNAPSAHLPTAEAAAGTSTVTNLRLNNGTAPSPPLACILKIPAALTHLTYSGSHQGCDFDDNLALQPLRATLQYLDLRFTNSAGTISSLRDWPALRTLRCSLTVLLGRGPKSITPRLAELLPASLQEFALLRDRYWSVAAEVAQGVELLRHKEDSVPRLVTLAVVVSRGARWRDTRFQDQLRAACEGAGVALEDSAVWGGEKPPRRVVARMGARSLI